MWHRSMRPLRRRSQTRTSPRNPSTKSPCPHAPPLKRELLACRAFGKPAQDLVDQRQLCSTSRTLIQTRALTSPSLRTGVIAGCRRADRPAFGARRTRGGRGRHSRRGILSGERRRGTFRFDGTILQRSGVVIEFDKRGKRADIIQHGLDGFARHRRCRGRHRRVRCYSASGDGRGGAARAQHALAASRNVRASMQRTASLQMAPMSPR